MATFLLVSIKNAVRSAEVLSGEVWRFLCDFFHRRLWKHGSSCCLRILQNAQLNIWFHFLSLCFLWNSGASLNVFCIIANTIYVCSLNIKLSRTKESEITQNPRNAFKLSCLKYNTYISFLSYIMRLWLYQFYLTFIKIFSLF